MNIHVASLKICQDYVIEKARQLVLSERIHEARNLLQNLDNMTEDHIVDFLSGNAVLRNNEIIYSANMTEEEKEEIEAYKEDLQFMHTGKIRKNNGWYQPYAVIEYFEVSKFYSLIKEEFALINNEKMSENLLRNLSSKAHFPLVTVISQCSKAYAEKIVQKYGYPEDIIEFVNFSREELKYIKNAKGVGHVVVFKKTSEYPYFMPKPTKNVKEAVLQILKNDQSLEDIGSTSLDDPKSLYWDEDLPFSNKDEVEQISQTTEDPEFTTDLKSWNQKNYQLKIQEFDQNWSFEKISQMKEKIREQAKTDGFIEFSWQNTSGETQTISLPKAPFLRWAFESKSLIKQFPTENVVPIEWKNICPEGFRIDGDIPDHSDWMIGASPDIHPMEWYNDQNDENILFQKAAYDKALELINEINNTSYHGQILTGGKNIEGYAWHPTDGEMPPNAILILKDLNPRYYDLMMKCQNEGTGIVISEAGGEMAHLTNVARENNITILRMSNARKVCPSQKKILIKTEGKGFKII